MLNFMCIEGYVKDDPQEFGNEEFKGCKFTLSTKALHFASKNQHKYMYVNVVVFGEGRVNAVMTGVKAGDFVGVLGKYNLAPVGKKYFPQLVLEELNKNFASGSVPEKDTIAPFENEKEETLQESEMNW